jgi:hypothetical protein
MTLLSSLRQAGALFIDQALPVRKLGNWRYEAVGRRLVPSLTVVRDALSDQGSLREQDSVTRSRSNAT